MHSNYTVAPLVVEADRCQATVKNDVDCIACQASACAAQAANSDPSSPCIGVCRMHPQTGLCEGCWRTVDEIAQWASASAEYKRTVGEAIERRQAATDDAAWGASANTSPASPMKK